MSDTGEEADLGRQIDALSARLPASAGEAAEPELVAGLADMLVARYRFRLAAGDRAGAGDDLGELVRRLEGMLAWIGTSHPRFADAALTAGFARGERWSADGDPADRDAAIGHLSSLAAVASGWEPALLDVHAALARLLGSRSEDAGPADGPVDRQRADLDAAIEHARAGLAGAAGQLPGAEPASSGTASSGTGIADPDVIIELEAILGFALAERFGHAQFSLLAGAAADDVPGGDVPGGEAPGAAEDDGDSVTAQAQADGAAGDPAGVAAARADRDHAVGHLSAVLGALPGDDPAWADIAETLGRLRYDRYDDSWPGGAPPDPADLDAAIDLLQAAVAMQAAAGEPGRPAVLYLFLALSDRTRLRPDPADRDALITWGERLLVLDAADGDADPDLHDIVGGALLDRAEDAVSPAVRRADLDAAVGHLETVLAATGPAAGDRAGLVAQLAHASWLRLDGDDAPAAEVDKMTAYATEAWRLLDPGDEARADIGVYLATGLYEQLRRAGQPFEPESVNLGIEVLTETEQLVTGDPDLHLFMVVLLGQFLVARGQATGASADLLAAQPWLLQAADRLPAGDPRFAEIGQTLASAMSVLAMLGMNTGHLDRAIGVLTASVRNPGAEPDRVAMTRGVLGTMLVQRAGFTRGGQDFDDGVAHLTASYDMMPAGDPYRILAAWNLGSALLIRYQRTGDVQDRDAARYYLGAFDGDAGPLRGAVRELVPDFDMMRAAMHGLLRLSEGIGGDPGALDDAVENLGAALAMLPAGHPYQGRIRSDLALALATRAAHGNATAADLGEAARELDMAGDALPRGHLMRPLVLMRTGASLAAAAFVAADPRLLREAIDYITSALGEIEPQFGGRPRMIASLGMSWERLHRLTGEAAAIDAAVACLTEACQEFSAQPDQPEYANCLNQLAQAHRVRGNTARARETGLAALRVRGREVLLQTGTARGLGFARTAAAGAAELASWCIDDGQQAEALDALELGRGLILHAATTVTSVPEMLIAAGRADLAGEWRREAASDPDAPWDASLAGPGLDHPGPDGVGLDGPGPHGAGRDGAGVGGAGVGGASQAGGLLAGTAPLRVPSDLRARALAVLSGSAGEQLLAAPARAAVAAALVSTGADALIYLLGPAGDRAGCAIIMPAVIRPPGAAPQVIMLPALRDSAGGAIDAYAAAQAALLAFPARPPGDRQDPAVQRWQAAETLAVSQRKHLLEALCAWAWPAVMGPLLDRARQWGLDHPPRLVLVPAGRLSLVPWHAACGPANGSGQPRHACAEAVISYAASSRQLIEVSRRPVLSLQASPVIVGDPTLDLPFAGLEALAIWEHCYPAARFLGHPGPLAARDADGSGAPDEVLAQLPAAAHPGASMLHLGCHADVVTSAPGRSHLLLAGRQQLMLESVLRRASGRPSDAPGGLVSLAACRSDLAAADYDEALTLATAFLAAGAVTVVGAHWEVPDGATSLLIFMFHHFLAVGAQSPRDALRLAQLWMLDPHRAAPAEMPAYLAKDAGRADLAEVTAWAALTHQGR